MHPRERRAGWDISSRGIPVSRGVQHGGPSLHPDPPGIPSPRWPLQRSVCGVWAGWQHAAEERAAIQACW